MGVSYEFNWYLVVKEQDSIEQVSPELFKTKKQEARIYPIGSELPLITKADGCIGLAKIKEFTIRETETIIVFEIVERYNQNDVIAKHYFDNYKRLHV